MTKKQGVKYFDFDDFRLDVEKEQLLIQGKPEHLRRKPFQTLLILVRNHGRVVEKDEIFSEIWSDSFVEETNLTQHIYVLRKALERSGGRVYIETVPKRGYRFNAEVTEVFSEEGEIQAEPLLRHENPTLDTSSNDPTENSDHGLLNVPAEYRLNDNEVPIRDLNVEAGHKSQGNQWWSSRLFIPLAVVLMAAIFGGIYSNYRQPSAQPDETVKSIAVMPFRAIDEESRNEKLGLGMADAVIVRLGRIRNIPVRPTSTVFQYTDGQNFDSLEVGRQLAVDGILEGTVQRDGERVRVSVQLVNVRNGKTVWAETFNERFTDLFAVQDAISERLVRALAVSLSSSEMERLARRPTTDVQAYQYYMLGTYFWNTRTREGLENAVKFLNLAVERDPNYADAYAGLADAYNMQYEYRYQDSEQLREKAKNAAITAIGLDPSAAKAYVALAYIQIIIEKNTREGRKSLEKAIELSPYDSTARLRYAWVLLFARQLDDAVREMRLAQEYDPLSPVSNAALCGMLILKRTYDEALVYCDRASAINPNTPTIAFYRANTLFFKGMREDAIGELEKFTAENPRNFSELGALGYFYAKTGNRRQAESAVAKLMEAGEKNTLYLNDAAIINHALGRGDIAKNLLDRSLRSGTLTSIALFDPLFDEVRSDPEFASVFASIPQS